MSVSIDTVTLNTEYIIGFNINSEDIVQLPKWLNQEETIIETFHNKEISTIEYVVRLSDSEKWDIDNILRNHELITLTDTIYGIDNDTYLVNVEYDYTFSHFPYYWNSKITLIGNI